MNVRRQQSTSARSLTARQYRKLQYLLRERRYVEQRLLLEIMRRDEVQ